MDPQPKLTPILLETASSEQESLANGWFVKQGEEHSGPLTWKVLRVIAERDMARNDVTVWHPTLNRWLPIQEIVLISTQQILGRESATGMDASPENDASRVRENWRNLPSDGIPLMILGLAFAGFIYWFSQLFPNRLGANDLAYERQESALLAGTVVDFQAQLRPADIELCNKSKSPKVYAAVAFFDAAVRQWSSRGWYILDQGRCVVLPVKGVKAPVYVYGEVGEKGKRWSGGPKGELFCIRDRRAFDLSVRDCHMGFGPGLRWEGFSKVSMDPRTKRFAWVARD